MALPRIHARARALTPLEGDAQGGNKEELQTLRLSALAIWSQGPLFIVEIFTRQKRPDP